MKLRDSIIIILAVVIAIGIGVFVGIKLTDDKNNNQNLNGDNSNIQDNIEKPENDNNNNANNNETDKDKVDTDNDKENIDKDDISQEITDSIINQAQESANKNTIRSYAQDLERKYLLAMVQESKVEWIDTKRKIDFSKAPKYEYANIVCSGDSYIDEDGKVTLSICKVDDYETLYNYKNGVVTSVAQEITDSIINQAQESANKMTIESYAQDLQRKYLLALVQESKVGWIDAKRKIDFSKAPKYEYANIVCTGDSYIDEDGKVTLSDCKIDNHKVLYNYKNSTVTSNAN